MFIRDEKLGTTIVHSLRPVPSSEWVHVQVPLDGSVVNRDGQNTSIGASEVEQEVAGILLDPNREVRAKMFMGEVGEMIWHQDALVLMCVNDPRYLLDGCGSFQRSSRVQLTQRWGTQQL